MTIQIPELPANLINSLIKVEPKNDWYRIVDSTDDKDTTDLYIYDAIGGWFGVYADDFIKDLNAVTTPNVNLHLNSPGGSVFEGIAIHNAIWQHKANVTVYIDSLAASIASVIALAGDEVVMVSHSQLMIHNARGGNIGDAQMMRDFADLLDKLSDNIASMYAEKAGGTTADWRTKMTAETWYSPEEALADKLIDRIYTKADKKAEKSTENSIPRNIWDLSVYTYAGRENAPDPIKKREDPVDDDQGADIGDILAGVFKAERKNRDFDPESFKDMLKGVVL